MTTQAVDASNPEHVLLAIILLDPIQVYDAALDPADFTDIRAERLWNLILERMAASQPVTMMDLVPAVAGLDIPGLDGGWLADLFSMAGSVSLPGEAHRAAERIRQLATKRRLVMAGTRIAQTATEVPAEEVMGAEDDAVRLIQSVFESSSLQRIESAGDALDEVVANLVVPASRPIPTPWAGLNRLINGWSPGRLYCLAAATGGGKSILALQIARGLCKHGLVAFSSLEMMTGEVVHRAIAQTAKINLGSLTNPPLSEAEMRNIERNRAGLADLHNLKIDDRPNVTVHDIERFAREVARQGPLVGIFVDYIQIVRWHGPQSTNMREKLADMSWKLKALSKTLQVPVFMLAQVNRTGQAREKNEPTMNDLRDSADLENNSDAVIMTWIEDPEFPTQAMMKVAKARGWSTGSFRLLRLGEYAMFDNADAGDYSSGWS